MAENIEGEVDRRMKSKLEVERRAFSEGRGAGGAGERARSPQLSDVEAEVAKGFGMKPEDYIKWRDGGALA